jgi:hypothetical protein
MLSSGTGVGVLVGSGVFVAVAAAITIEPRGFTSGGEAVVQGLEL